MQLIQLALQLRQVLTAHQVIDDLLVAGVLAMGQVLDQAMPVQEIDYLREAVLQAVLGFLDFYFGH
ncbi:hypothetical protein D3C77_774410 [compost metagenome]